MGSQETTQEPRYEDVLGQFPQLKTYNHGVFLFPIEDDSMQNVIKRDLEAAAEKIVSQVPWLGHQVINEGAIPGENSGHFTTTPWPSSIPRKLVIAKDCRDFCPSYAEIIAAQGPVSMLNGDLLCPFPGFPLSYNEKSIGPAPVVAVQANFIKGGLLLNFSNQHNMMDATGLFTYIMLIATAMRGEEIPKEILEQANRDPKTVVPLLPEGEEVKNYSHLIRPPGGPPAFVPPKSPYTWAYFRTPKSTVVKIKALAHPSPDTSHGDTVPFISSNDALCAHYWKRLASIRIANGASPSSVSKFSRAIDTRAAMKVPMGFMGQMVYQAACHLSLSDLSTLPLPTITSKLRKALNDANNEFSIRSYATFLASVPDKTTLAYAGLFNPATDIGSSSMSTAEVKLGFGELGEPQMARRPKLAPVPGCLYFYPPEAGGELPVLLCLSEEDLQGMREDGEWGGWMEYIG